MGLVFLLGEWAPKLASLMSFQAVSDLSSPVSTEGAGTGSGTGCRVSLYSLGSTFVKP